ncbi:MAG TPA: protein kinase [Anaerolineales bacterium]|nr:protein kinase [Anaerolineales bacterium]
MIGKTIGRYQIVELLGRGGMAEVYKAYQKSLDRYVAIKLMHAFLSEDKDFFERFNREAKNVATLSHANIIQIHDFDHEGETYYMVMEFVDGGTLKDRLEQLTQGQRLPLDEAVRITQDVGSALAYSHKRGMIHRDVKPANVMIDSTGHVKLTDYGIAKILSGAKFTASGSILGTPAYMAPEQGLGQPGDARSDIYSLGVILYRLVTGRLPYDADTPIAIILKHVNEDLPLPRVINPELPKGIENVIVKALAKDPAQRYQSVDDMLRDLDNLDAAEHIQLPADSTVASRPGDRTIRTALPEVRTGGARRQKLGVGAPTAGATQVVPPSGLQPRRNLLPVILGGIAVVVVAVIIGAVVVGGGFLVISQQPTTVAVVSNTPQPTETPKLTGTSQFVGTPTTDPLIVAITEQAATLAALLATKTPTPTPNLTAAFEACNFDVSVEQQDPKDGAGLPVGKSVNVTLTLKNAGDCAWDDQTVFAYASGDKLHDPSQDQISVAAAQPGETVTVKLTLKAAEQKAYSAGWQVRLSSGRDVGKPISLNYKGSVAATAAPRPTSTNTPAPQPTVPTGGGPITGANPTFFSCTYVQNTTDYECLTSIGVGGGTAPFTITIDGRADQTGVQTPQNPYFFQLRGRRCIVRLFSFRVVDANGQVFDGNGAFDPTTAKLFNNNTEVCGLG